MTEPPAKTAVDEGGLGAPLRAPLDWRSDAFYDEAAIETEMERVFDICHGCRRCFNLCDSFPLLFDMIDESATGEVDGVAKSDYKKVVDACTLCDMCFMTKCPYVPPHLFALDFPHLMLRHRAAERKKHGGEFVREQLGETDRNGKLAKPVAGMANWITRRDNTLARAAMETVAGIDRDAELPKYHSKTATDPADSPHAQPHRPGVRPAQGGDLRHLFRRLQRPPPPRQQRWLSWQRRASRPAWPIRPAAACLSSRPAIWRASPKAPRRSPRSSAR